MPRGKNYVNQHKGMALKAASKEAVKELCFYGSACQRKDCIYRHDKTAAAASSTATSSDPCMAYLSGFCSFTAKTCRKRHPTSDAEVEALIRKYASFPCRFGVNCKTKGCLYMHPDDENASNNAANGAPTVILGRPMAYPLPNLPQPYGPPAVRPSNNSKAMRRTLMDPNAFPPLGAEPSATTHEMNPPVCLPAAPVAPPIVVATPAPPPHFHYPTYTPNDNSPMGAPLAAIHQNGGAMMHTPSPMSSYAAPTVPPPSLESSTSSASWNLKAQEFVPRGLI